MFSAGVAAGVGVVAAAVARAGPPVLIGVDAQAAQLVQIDPVSCASTLLGAVSNETVGALAWDSHRGILFAASTSTGELLRINPQNGATTVVGPMGALCCIHGLEYSPLEAALFGLKSGVGTPEIYRIDPLTGAATLVSSSPALFGSLAFDPALPPGTMYASQIFTDQLFRVDIATGAATAIGPFGIPGQIGVALAFHPAFGLYASDNNGTLAPDDLLYRINTTTGQATLVGPTTTGNLLGLAFVGDPCYPDCNADGALSVADFGCFQTRFVAGSGYADCNGDGVLTAADFGCFQTKFVVGCP